MVNTYKLCTRCGKNIIQIRDIPIANHTNIEHPDDVHYFCSRECKLIWLAERMEKSEEAVGEEKETFKCKYCGRIFDKKKSATIHGSWCDKNPNARSRITKNKLYTMEDIREIDRVFGLTDGQIARFVRGSGSNK